MKKVKTKKLLFKIFLPLLLVFMLLFNLTACSQDRFMGKGEYLKNLPAGGLIDCTITLRINSYGDHWETYELPFVLSYNDAPITVTNFVYLVQSGFYDYTKFDENANAEMVDAAKPVMHRLEKSAECFILQGGGYKTNSTNSSDIVELRTGGLDYTIKGEFEDNGWNNNNISHKAGVISMARQSAYDTAASEFFITFNDCSEAYDGQYAAFGYIKSDVKIDGKLLNVLSSMTTSSERFSFSTTYLSNYPKNKIEILSITLPSNLISFPKSLQIAK